MIRVLIVDDSPVIRMVYKRMINAEDDMEVVGEARNGQEGVDMACELCPDLITMDIEMPEMNGFEATREIMDTCPAPIIVISTLIEGEMMAAFNAIEAGALTALQKPHAPGHEDFEEEKAGLLASIRNMSSVNVEGDRWFFDEEQTFEWPDDADIDTGSYEVLALGAATGGPQQLYLMLSGLDDSFPLPIIITQRFTEGFFSGLMEWFDENLTLSVSMAQHGELLLPGNVYFALDNHHLTVGRLDGDLVALNDKQTVDEQGGHCPSLNVMFASVAKTCGDKALAGILSGEGNDGAIGLLSVHEQGGYAFIQDEQSALVNEMPDAALVLNENIHVVKLDQMASHLTLITQLEAE